MNHDAGSHVSFTEADAIEAGQLAYSAYGKAVRFRNFQGDPMPDWGSLPGGIKAAWSEAAKAVAAKVLTSAVVALTPSDAHPVSRRQNF